MNPHPSWKKRLGVFYHPVRLLCAALDGMLSFTFEFGLPLAGIAVLASFVVFGVSKVLTSDLSRRTRIVCEDRGQTREWVAVGVVRRPHNSPGVSFEDEEGVEHVILSGACSFHPIPQPVEAPDVPSVSTPAP